MHILCSLCLLVQQSSLLKSCFCCHSNQHEKHHPDGTKEISYPNGAVRTIYPSGEEKAVMADGTVQVLAANGDKTIQFPDGQKEVHTKLLKVRERGMCTVCTCNHTSKAFCMCFLSCMCE